MSFSLTRKTDYALVALSVLADNARAKGEPLSAREISAKHDLPLPLLMNVLKELHKAKIVCSRRGAGGGYSLCHDPATISLARIIEATEGPVNIAMCCEESEPEPCVPCRVQRRCPITNPMQRFNQMVHEFLSRVTLKDLIEQPAETQQQLVALTTGAK
jgi:Rrf2 family protein